MRVLIDTNVFIDREGNKPLSASLLELFKVLDAIDAKILVHPRSVDDLQRDENPVRRATNLSKIGAYSVLESPPETNSDDEFSQLLQGSLTENDRIDDALLYAVYRNAVHYLITEDKEMLRKAQKAGIRDKVLSIYEASNHLARHVAELQTRYPPALSRVPLHSLNLKDPFFDTLKADYPEFEDWFKGKARSGLYGLVYLEEDGRIGAFLLLKHEGEMVNCRPPLEAKPRVKISTLKVTHQGYKIGELFVKIAVQEAVQNNVNEIYLTHFTKRDDELVQLIEEYGFHKVAENERREDVFLKSIHPTSSRASSLSSNTVNNDYYPSFYDGNGVKKFIVPILPTYHDRLFVDYAGRQTTLPEHAGQFIVEGNTIKKAYLSNSKNKTLSKGDILLFYRSGDNAAMTSLGTVESVHRRVRSLQQAAELVEKRTVYTIDEIQEKLKKPMMIILFKWHFYLRNPISLKELSRINISPPQSITRISHAQYSRLKVKGGIDERFTVN